MKTALLNKHHLSNRGEMHRTTPIDTIAAMKPLRDTWWQVHNKNQILVKDTKKKSRLKIVSIF